MTLDSLKLLETFQQEIGARTSDVNDFEQAQESQRPGVEAIAAAIEALKASCAGTDAESIETELLSTLKIGKKPYLLTNGGDKKPTWRIKGELGMGRKPSLDDIVIGARENERDYPVARIDFTHGVSATMVLLPGDVVPVREFVDALGSALAAMVQLERPSHTNPDLSGYIARTEALVAAIKAAGEVVTAYEASQQKPTLAMATRAP